MVRIRGVGAIGVSHPEPRMDLSQLTPIEVRMIRVGSWCQIIVDDVPRALVPVDVIKPAFTLRALNASVHIESVEFWQLHED